MRLRMETKLLAILAVSTAGTVPGPAAAQSQTWSITGAGCVPTGQTASGTGTVNSAGDVKYPAGRTGEIIVTCVVPPVLAVALGLNITYRDTDGAGNVVRLSAVLRQKLLATGAVSDVSGANFDSNLFPAATGNVRRGVQIGNTCNGNPPFKFDHSRFTYFVQVNMIKRTTVQDVLLASVDIAPILC